jgi:hypothetical protein
MCVSTFIMVFSFSCLQIYIYHFTQHPFITCLSEPSFKVFPAVSVLHVQLSLERNLPGRINSGVFSQINKNHKGMLLINLIFFLYW